MNARTRNTYQKHGIKKRYDSQQNYGKHKSYYGDGKYPPDWDARRDAVWDRQRYQCARCGIYKGDAAVNEVHHVIHLTQGGSNALDNLVGLCGDCHALMHPDVDALRGTVRQADLFPGDHADDRVAVIRKPKGNDELEFDVDRLSQFSTPDDNANAVTSESVPTSPETARRARTSLQRILLDHGFVPRTTAYHRITVQQKPANLLAAISIRGVDLTARSDGETMEVEETGTEQINVYYSSDTTLSELELQDPAGEVSTDKLTLDDSEGSRLRVEKPISGPPLTVGTTPEYMLGALKYFGWESMKLGVVPGLILAFFLPSLIPAGGSISGLVGFILLVGLFIRLPAIYRDVAATTSNQTVNERSESD